MRRRPVLAILVLTVAALTFAIVAPSAGAIVAGDQPASTTTEAPGRPQIIPRPNSGAEPTDPGDRGGSLQTGVFILVMAGVVVIGALIVRESRKARAERGF